ncbi:hypothetical protein WME97_10470 [Sorangium sp. So ce367]|uniref:hypothetical protein n=1 Tax=Sorangium sp. So ce367 TaxID=3133305 RepID=UPI003F6407D9
MNPTDNSLRSAGRPAHPRRVTTLTLLYGGIILVQVVRPAVSALAPAPLRQALDAATWIPGSLFVAGIIVGLTWLYKAWARVPAPARQTYDGRHVEPGDAVVKLFIPLYGYYWIFVANVGLCGAIENHARRQYLARRAPSTLAMVACIVQVIPYVGLVLGPLFWLPFMIKVDLAQRELEG